MLCMWENTTSCWNECDAFLGGSILGRPWQKTLVDTWVPNSRSWCIVGDIGMCWGRHIIHHFCKFVNIREYDNQLPSIELDTNKHPVQYIDHHSHMSVYTRGWYSCYQTNQEHMRKYPATNKCHRYDRYLDDTGHVHTKGNQRSQDGKHMSLEQHRPERRTDWNSVN